MEFGSKFVHGAAKQTNNTTIIIMSIDRCPNYLQLGYGYASEDVDLSVCAFVTFSIYKSSTTKTDQDENKRVEDNRTKVVGGYR
jgi:hypothetical protein